MKHGASDRRHEAHGDVSTITKEYISSELSVVPKLETAIHQSDRPQAKEAIDNA